MGCIVVVIIILTFALIGYWVENPVAGTIIFLSVSVISILSYIYNVGQKKKEVERQKNAEIRRKRLLEEAIERELQRKQEKENAWEFQIRSGNLPVNVALKDENRNNYFVNMRISHKYKDTIELCSSKFGDAMDALTFARELRRILDCSCYVRKSENSKTYYVIANIVSELQLQRLMPFSGAEGNVFEFKNPVFGADDYSNVSSAQQLEDELTPPYSNGVEYEKYIAAILKQQGFVNVSLTPASGDYGADILAVYNGTKVCIQCKFYSSAVGIAAVQEIIGAKSHYKCDAAAVITNSTFTSAAKQLASESGVQLCENIT